MRGNAQSNETRNGNRKGRAKAKSCRTCKIRKVKCDEDFPACRRCASTGRVCDGYGVWGGGGGNGQDGFVSNACRVAPRPPSSIYLIAASAEDKYYFEWFKCRTSKKIPGLFVLPFWNTLLFQASLNEPAVLHAVLTLSCVHKNGNTEGRDHDSPDGEERLMLSNYSKAISYLKPHFSNKNRSSIRIALITCVVFVCLEIFRGHFKAALTHLHNGLHVLIEMQDQYRVADDGILLLGAFSKSIDDWILEAFSRLQIQVALFNRSCEHPILNLQVSGLGLPNFMFYSFNDAWKPLEQILYQVFHLNNRIRGQRGPETTGLVASTGLLKYQQRIKAELGEWSDIYETSRKEIQGRLDPEYKEYEEFTFRLLSAYNTMASIMADTCLFPGDESVFDSFTEEFVSMMENLVYNWTIRSMDVGFPAEAGPIVDLSRSVIDIGWIPPLYYTATKCRVHRLRLHAIRLLEASTHREGIWDSKIAACVARKIMEIEEKNFYRDLGTVDDFPISNSPGLGDLSAPLLPLSYRVHDVKVDLPDGPMDSIFLSYKQKEIFGEWRVYSKEFNVVRQCWIDA